MSIQFFLLRARRVLLAGVCFATTSLAFGQGSVHVDINSTAAVPDGLTWASAFRTVQEGLDLAATGMTPASRHVLVAEGTYVPTVTYLGTNQRYQAFQFRDADTHLHGGFQGISGGPMASVDWTNPDGSFADTILTGNLPGANSYHVIVADGATFATPGFIQDITIDGLMIRDGGPHGGGLAPAHTLYGGGLYVVNGTRIVVENCIFENNQAQFGGAIYSQTNFTRGDMSGAGFQLRSSILRNNVAVSDGGGIYFARESMSPGNQDLCNVIFKSNTASLRGGGFFAEAGTSGRYSNVLMFRNRANTGGAAYIQNEQPMIANIEDHYFWCCTVANNAAAAAGGVFIGPGTTSMNSDIRLRNSIVWDNTSFNGGDIQHTGVPGDVTFDWGDTGVVSNVTVTNSLPLGTNALFVNPSAGDYKLQSGSLCVDFSPFFVGIEGPDVCDINDNGFYNDMLPIDLRGSVRYLSFGLDIGAYER